MTNLPNSAHEQDSWGQKRLVDLVSFDKGRVVICVSDPEVGTIPYIGADSFGGTFGQYTRDDTALKCETSDVLMLWDGERSGLCATGLCGAIGSTVARLRPKTGVDGRFLYRQLARHFNWIQARRTGTGVPHVPRDLGSTLFLGLPASELEQSRIAALLDTMDRAIAKTEAVIEKLKQMRAGLLQDLLTLGLDENGQLRDPIAHPEQFHDSPLGPIPKEWELCGISDIAPSDRQAILTGPFGAQLGQLDFVNEGVPVLRIGNVQAGYIDWTDVQHVSHPKAVELRRYSVVPGDLLFARQGATTGRNALADERSSGALINYHIIRVATDPSRCEPIFLHALFNSDQSLRQINRDKGRGTREGINTKQIASLRFALPKFSEQRRAVDVLQENDANSTAEVLLKTKLTEIKSGLMTDLLTGQVRVPQTINQQ